MDITGGAILIRFFEKGIFDKTMIREEDNLSASRKFSEAGGQIELQELKDITEEIFKTSSIRVNPFIDAPDLPEGLLSGEKLQLSGRRGRVVSPEGSLLDDPELVGHRGEKILFQIVPQVPTHSVHQDEDAL